MIGMNQLLLEILFLISVAYRPLVLNDRDNLKYFIYFGQTNYRYATWKHRCFINRAFAQVLF